MNCPILEEKHYWWSGKTQRHGIAVLTQSRNVFLDLIPNLTPFAGVDARLSESAHTANGGSYFWPD